MTKRSAVERPKYITLTLAVYKNDTEPRIELVKQANSDEAPEPKAEGNGANGPRGKTIHLDARTWYVWKRNGGVERMLGMLCKPEYCSHCDEQRVSDESYHGWFCYTCQRTLANLNLLPDGDPKNDLEEEEPFVPAFLEDDEDEDED